MKALFIDNSPAWLKSFALGLKGLDVVCIECHSTTEAIRAIQKESPDILFLDDALTLGGHEGLEVMDWIDRKITVYTTSMSNDPVIKAKYLAKGAGFASKANLKAMASIIRDRKGGVNVDDRR